MNNDIRALALGQLVAFGVAGVVLSQQGCNLFAEDGLKFTGAHILVACYALFYPTDDIQCGVHAHVGGDKHLFEVVEHIVVHLALASHGTCQLTKETLFGFLETAVQRLFLLLLVAGEEIQESHIHFIFAVQKYDFFSKPPNLTNSLRVVLD